MTYVILRCRNLSFSVTEEEIHEAFSQWGEITYVKLLTDPLTERSRGVAFVQYKTKAEADKCQEAYEDREQVGDRCTEGCECWKRAKECRVHKGMRMGNKG